VIQDRTIYEDAHIFAKNLHLSGFLNHRDYENYRRLFNSFKDLVKPPDLLIYLRANVSTLVERIQKRGREYEQNIQLNYLKNLGDHYEEWIGQYKEGRLLIIDVNHLDFVQRPEDFGTIVSKVDRELFGLF
jgi:deoxyadenosine/deoxycytidine kinase